MWFNIAITFVCKQTNFEFVVQYLKFDGKHKTQTFGCIFQIEEGKVKQLQELFQIQSGSKKWPRPITTLKKNSRPTQCWKTNAPDIDFTSSTLKPMINEQTHFSFALQSLRSALSSNWAIACVAFATRKLQLGAANLVKTLPRLKVKTLPTHAQQDQLRKNNRNLRVKCLLLESRPKTSSRSFARPEKIQELSRHWSRNNNPTQCWRQIAIWQWFLVKNSSYLWGLVWFVHATSYNYSTIFWLSCASFSSFFVKASLTLYAGYRSYFI